MPESTPKGAQSLLAGQRVLCVMPAIPLYGMERATIRIMRGLREHGADVLFVAVKEEWGAAVRREIEAAGCHWEAVSLSRGLGLPRSYADAKELWAHWRKLRKGVTEIANAYSPTHMHLPNLTHFLYAMPERGDRPASAIFRLPNPPTTSLGAIKRLGHNWLWRRVVRDRADVFVCNCDYTANELRRVVGDVDVRVIRNSFMKPQSGEGSSEHRKPTGRHVVYAGQISPSKGVDLLFFAAEKLVAQLPDVHIWFAGDYTWRNPLGDYMARRVSERNLDRIHLLGHIDYVPELLRGADVHVCPSVSPNESSPNVVLEAKSAGVPTVAFAAGGIPELVHDGEDGVICSEQSGQALYQSITRLLTDDSGRLRLADGATASLERYDRTAIEREWVDLYLETAG